MILREALRMLVLVAGAVTHLIVLVLMTRKPVKAGEDWRTLAAAAGALVWFSAQLGQALHTVGAGDHAERYAAIYGWIAAVGGAVALTQLLRLSVEKAGWGPGASWASWLLLAAGVVVMGGVANGAAAGVWFGFTVAGAAAASWIHSRRASSSAEDWDRGYFRFLALALLLFGLAGALVGAESPAFVLAAMTPALLFLHFVYRTNYRGLLISRRFVFAFQVGTFIAVYVVFVRALARQMEDRLQLGFVELNEVVLISALLLVYFPLYGRISRFLAEPARLYGNFSTSLIENAAAILDFGARISYFATEVGRALGFRRVLLVSRYDRLSRGYYGVPLKDSDEPDLEKLEQEMGASGLEMAHPWQTPQRTVRETLSVTPFTYAFLLRYEEKPTGLLLVDSHPRLLLDEKEAIMLGLSRLISHSLENCRVVGAKIGLERELLQQEHLADLGRLAATIAHDVKNPLSSIKTLAQLMAEDPDVAEKYARDLGFIVGQTDRLNGAVQQLLSYSRPLPPREERLNLSELLERTCEVLERQQSSRIQRTIQPGIWLERTNPQMVEQIFLNIVLNALQAAPVEGRVEVWAGEEAGGKASIAVVDEGPGVPPEMQGRVFEPFFTTKQQGTGLGLAIVRRNTRYLGGDVTLVSPVQDGRGTLLRISLLKR
jgi:signal transduction histidine kinase